MKAYLMNITGAVLITVLVDMLLPDKWAKYIKILTGLIIISAVTMPLKSTFSFDISDFMLNSEEIITQGNEYSKKLVKKELSERINSECEKMLYENFGKNANVNCTLAVNDEGKIEGINSIEVFCDSLSDKAVSAIYNSYSPKEVTVNGHQKNP